MAGKGTCESIAILGLIQTMSEQFVEQTQEKNMAPSLKEIIAGIDSSLNDAFRCWKESLTHRDLRRIKAKLESLSDKIPMDREYDITVCTSFALSLLEDFSQKLKPGKQKAIRDLTMAVLKLHEYFTKEEEVFDHNLSGAISADAWQMEGIR